MSERPAQLQRLLWVYHAFHGAQDGIILASALKQRYEEEWMSDRKTAIRDRNVLDAWGGGGCLCYDGSLRAWRLVRRFELPEELRVLQPLPQSQERLVSVARDVLRSTQGSASLVTSVLDGMAGDPLPHVSVFAPPRLGRDSQGISELWLRLHESITVRQRVILKRKGKESVQVDPLYLWWAQGGWYLLVRGSQDKELKSYALARLEAVEARSGLSYPALDFDPKKWLGNGDWLYRGGKTVTARIRFDPKAVASFRDRIWQTDVAWKDQPDGSVLLLHPYPSRAHGEWEMARRILGWGEYCTVEAPVSLCRRIKMLLADISRRYS